MSYESDIKSRKLTSSLKLVRVVGNDDVGLSASKQQLPFDRRNVAEKRVIRKQYVSVHYF